MSVTVPVFDLSDFFTFLYVVIVVFVFVNFLTMQKDFLTNKNPIALAVCHTILATARFSNILVEKELYHPTPKANIRIL
jgi:hypothetical protein